MDLALGFNALSGTIPSKWASKALTSLELQGNKLTGPLPVWSAPSLQTYSLGSVLQMKCAGNQLSGQIPTDLAAHMPQLKALSIPCKQLSGALPPQLRELSQLDYLDVAHNQALTGTLPPSLAQPANLKVFDVGYTSISGTIPQSYGALKSLNKFEIKYSKVSGCVPSSMASIEYIEGRILQWAPNVKEFCK